MSDIITSSFQDQNLSITIEYQPPNLVNVEDDINQTRVILRQPATIVNFGDRPLLEYAEVATSASYAKSASFISDDSDIYDWVRTTFYVSATDGSDDNDGKTPIYPFKTIKRAALAAKNFITGSKLIDPTIPEEAPRVTIRLSTGFYEEEAPIQIPEWTSVCGNDLRTCVVRPTPETKNQNLFQINRGFYADGLRLEGCEIDDLTNPRTGFFFAFQEGAYITTSPYIQNCTAAFVPFDKFYAPLDAFATPQPNPAIGNGPGGMIVDDSVLDGYSPLKSMIVDAYTQVAFNGIGLVTRGAGYAQMVSFFTNFSHVGTWAIDGGHASLLNSNTTFGDYGLRSEGYRVIVVPDYEGVNSYQSEADSQLLSSSIADVQAYMMNQLQLSGSYRTDYVDTNSRVHKLTLKDSGLLVDALATDLLALTPGKTVNWVQSQFKGQDVSPDQRYTIPTASGFEKGPFTAFRVNDNTYTASVPFTEPSTSRDSGYLVNATATDILYGGNERSVEAARWFWVRPSVANTTQLQPTLDGIQIVKDLAKNALESVSQSAFVSKSSANILLSYQSLEEQGTGSLPTIVPNTVDNIKVTNLSSVTISTTISSSLINQATGSFETVYNIIENGTGSMPTLVTNAENLIRVTTASAQFTTGSSALSRVPLVVSGFNIVLNIVENGTGSIPTKVLNTNSNIRVTAFTPTTSSASATATEVSSSETLFGIVTSIITNGTGSLPAVLSNASESIKVSNTPQITSSSAASGSEVTTISSSFAIVNYIIINGTGSMPVLIENTSESIKFNNTAQITSASGAGNTEVTKISSSAALVTNIITNGTGSLPTLILNTSESIKFTNTAQVTSASSATQTEVTKVSSSVAIVTDIITNGTGSLPIIVYNTEENIKFTNTAQIVSGSLTGSSSDVSAISASIALVADIVANGTGSLPGVIPYTTPSSDPNTIAAYNLLKDNIPFIQAEVIAYISSSWSTASYNEASCSRDVGYIVSGAAEDLLYGSNSSSIYNGVYYYEFPSQATGTQLNFTVDGIKFANRLAQKVVQNITFTTGSAERRATWDLLRANRTLLQNEVIAYISSSWSTASYNENTCKRDVGYIIDAVSTDVYYGGNERSIEAGRYYYLYPSQATGSQLNFTIDGINHASGLAQQLIQNITLVTGSIERRATWDLLRANKAFIQSEVISYISSSWSTASYNQDTCYRDVGYIIDGIVTDIYYGGNQRSIESGRYYFLYPSQATGNQLDFTVDGINYASRIAQKISQNVSFVTASTSRRIAWELLRANSPFVQAEVISYISSSWSTASYDETKCKRDVNHIIDAVSTDVYYGGNERSRQAGFYYYKYPSQATGSQVNFTVDGVEYASKLGQKVVQNVTFVTASTARQATWNLMRNNKTFIAEEVIAYISSSWPTASYDSLKCKRDVGYIVDSVSTDILYGGNERSIEAGRYYYLYPSQATTAQLNFTIDGINYAKELAKKLIVNTPYVTPNSASRAAKELLIRNKPLIQAEVIQYISSSWVTSSRSMVGFVYDQDKCFRDVGYILDGVATDILYGGNERSIESGRYYYLYPNEATNNRTQLDPTLDGIEYARDIAVKIVSGSTLVTASANVLAARNLIDLNKVFIQAETIAFLSSSWKDFNYNSVTCSRDIGYILDAVKTDLVYGGNQRSRDAGFYYYKYPNQATSAQDAATVAGVRYAKNLTQKILQNASFITASADRLAAWNALMSNKAYIQEQVVIQLKTNKSFDEDDTVRDAGYIVQAIATDFLYGGNERATEAGRYFYKFPSAVLDAVKSETLEGIALIKEFAQNYLENTIVKSEIPRLRQEVDLVYDILENGTGSIADVLVRNASGGTRFTTTPQFTSSATISVGLINSASNALHAVLDIIEYGTGSAPTLIKNTSNRVKKSALDPVLFTGSLSQSVIDLVTASAKITADILDYGTGSAPALIENNINNIVVSNITPYTGSVTASNAEITKVSSSFALVTNIIVNGTGSLPTLVRNTSESIKYTATPQITSSMTASATEVTKVSSSVAFIIKGISEGTGSLPPLVLNTAENIKFTTLPQTTASAYTFNPIDITKISASIALVADIVKNGTGSLPPLIPYGTASTDLQLVATYNLVADNIELIKAEVIAYISSSWSTASYNEASCSRDIGYIINGAIDDLLYGSNSASLASGIYYYLFPSEATGNQLNFTLDGIEFANNLTQKIAQNVTLVTASAARRNAWNLLNNNKAFIQDETIAYLSASWYGFDYDSAKCRRDVGYIIDGLATDIYYGGNQRSRESARYYYLYPSQANGTQLDQTIDGMEYASVLAQKVIQSIQFVTASESRLAVRDILYNNIPLLQEETVAYISSSWSTASYNEEKCKRDVGYIVGGIIADVLYGGNQRSIDSGVYYYRYPSQATTSQLDFTVQGINYTNRLAQKLLVNTSLVQPEANKWAAYNVVRASTPFIVAEIVPYISSSWSTLNYNTAKCERDSVYIIDSILTDFLYGGNERSIYSGNYYYLYNVSEVTSEQVEETTTGIKYIGNLIEAIMQSATFSYPTQNQLDAAELLFKNKTFIAEEIIPYVSASWTGSTYNADKCKRDVGYILDGVITDIVYGGNERSIESGISYYLYPLTVLQNGVYVRVNEIQPPATQSPAISNEKDFTYAGTRYLKGMAIEVLKNTIFQPVTETRQTVYNILTANKTAIAQAVLQALLDKQEKCMVCDYILAHNKIREYIVNDVEGRFVDLSPAAKTKVGQMMAMVTGTLESVVLNLEPTYLQEFGSLITSTSHVFEFGGSGANYLALPGNQYGIGQTNFDIRVFQSDGGRVFTSFGDETGDFFVGLDFSIKQASGTIEGRTFNKATAARFTPLILALT
jgi:hypothetical protein